MAGCHKHVVIAWNRADEWKTTRTAGAQPSPAALDRGLCQARHQPARQREQVLLGAGGGACVVADMLFGGADQNPAVLPGHQITFAPKQHMMNERRGGAEQSNLTADGVNVEVAA